MPRDGIEHTSFGLWVNASAECAIAAILNLVNISYRYINSDSFKHFQLRSKYSKTNKP